MLYLKLCFAPVQGTNQLSIVLEWIFVNGSSVKGYWGSALRGPMCPT